MSSFSMLLSTLWCSLLQFHLSLSQQQLIFSTSMTSSQFTHSPSVTFLSDSNCATTTCAKMPVSNPQSYLKTNLGVIDTTGYTDITLKFKFLYSNWGLGLFTIYQVTDASTNGATTIAQFDHNGINQHQQNLFSQSLLVSAANNPKLGVMFMAGTTSNNPTGNLVYIDDIQIFGTPMPADPTKAPTPSPTSSPTPSPTPTPTANPTPSPTIHPTPNPTASPTKDPTASPTGHPTPAPTMNPTHSPTNVPTTTPTKAPTKSPVTPQPTLPNAYHMPTMRPTFSHQEVDEGTTDSPEEYADKDQIKENTNSGNAILPIVCVILSLIIICGIIYFVYKKYKKKAVRKVSDTLFDYGMTNMNKASNIKAIEDNIEGEGLEISTNINNESVNTGTATGVDTNSENEMDDDIVDEVNDTFITKGFKSDSSIVIEGGEKRNRYDTFVVEDENEMEEDVIIGIDTKGNFEQNLGDNALGNDLLMDDIVNDMNDNNVSTPQ